MNLFLKKDCSLQRCWSVLIIIFVGFSSLFLEALAPVQRLSETESYLQYSRVSSSVGVGATEMTPLLSDYGSRRAVPVQSWMKTRVAFKYLIPISGVVFVCFFILMIIFVSLPTPSVPPIPKTLPDLEGKMINFSFDPHMGITWNPESQILTVPKGEELSILADGTSVEASSGDYFIPTEMDVTYTQTITLNTNFPANGQAPVTSTLKLQTETPYLVQQNQGTFSVGQDDTTYYYFQDPKTVIFSRPVTILPEPSSSIFVGEPVTTLDISPFIASHFNYHFSSESSSFTIPILSSEQPSFSINAYGTAIFSGENNFWIVVDEKVQPSTYNTETGFYEFLLPNFPIRSDYSLDVNSPSQPITFWEDTLDYRYIGDGDVKILYYDDTYMIIDIGGPRLYIKSATGAWQSKGDLDGSLKIVSDDHNALVMYYKHYDVYRPLSSAHGEYYIVDHIIADSVNISSDANLLFETTNHQTMVSSYNDFSYHPILSDLSGDFCGITSDNKAFVLGDSLHPTTLYVLNTQGEYTPTILDGEFSAFSGDNHFLFTTRESGGQIVTDVYTRQEDNSFLLDTTLKGQFETESQDHSFVITGLKSSGGYSPETYVYNKDGGTYLDDPIVLEHTFNSLSPDDEVIFTETLTFPNTGAYVRSDGFSHLNVLHGYISQYLQADNHSNLISLDYYGTKSIYIQNTDGSFTNTGYIPGQTGESVALYSPQAETLMLTDSTHGSLTTYQTGPGEIYQETASLEEEFKLWSADRQTFVTDSNGLTHIYNVEGDTTTLQYLQSINGGIKMDINNQLIFTKPVVILSQKDFNGYDIDVNWSSDMTDGVLVSWTSSAYTSTKSGLLASFTNESSNVSWDIRVDANQNIFINSHHPNKSIAWTLHQIADPQLGLGTPENSIFLIKDGGRTLFYMNHQYYTITDSNYSFFEDVLQTEGQWNSFSLNPNTPLEFASFYNHALQVSCEESFPVFSDIQSFSSYTSKTPVAPADLPLPPDEISYSPLSYIFATVSGLLFPTFIMSIFLIVRFLYKRYRERGSFRRYRMFFTSSSQRSRSREPYFELQPSAIEMQDRTVFPLQALGPIIQQGMVVLSSS